jgi:hypothetical protein
MTFVVDGTNGLTFNDATTQSSTATNASNISSGTLGKARLPTGSVLQVVQATYSTNTNTTSTSPVTTGLTASITPTSATSKVYVMIANPMRRNNGSGLYNGFRVYLYRNGSVIWTPMTNVGYSYQSTDAAVSVIVAFNYLDSPATTSATTYAMYFNANSGQVVTASSCVDNDSANIILMEIAA